MQVPKPGKTGAFGPLWYVVPFKKKTALARIMYCFLAICHSSLAEMQKLAKEYVI
jgi:hypothetical protein